MNIVWSWACVRQWRQCSTNNVVWLLHENQVLIAIFYVSKWICIRIFQIYFSDLFDVRYNKVLRRQSSFRSIHQVFLKRSHVLEEKTSSIFIVDGLFWVVAEIIRRRLVSVLNKKWGSLANLCYDVRKIYRFILS